MSNNKDISTINPNIKGDLKGSFFLDWISFTD